MKGLDREEEGLFWAAGPTWCPVQAAAGSAGPWGRAATCTSLPESWGPGEIFLVCRVGRVSPAPLLLAAGMQGLMGPVLGARAAAKDQGYKLRWETGRRWMDGRTEKGSSLGLSETGERCGAHVCVQARRNSGGQETSDRGNAKSQAGHAPYSPADSAQPLQLHALLVLVRGHAVPQLEDAVREAPVSVGAGGSRCQQPGQVPCQHREAK